MYKKMVLAACLICVIFISCINTEEKISLNADNSGTYQLNIDLSSMLAQMKAFMPQTDSLIPKEQEDQVIPLLQLLDSAPDEQKALFKEGTMFVHASQESNELSIMFVVPFKNTQDLAAIKQHLIEIIDVKKIASGVSGAAGMANEASKGLALISPTTGFTFTADKNSVSDLLSNRQLLNSLLTDQSIQQFRMLNSMGTINYKTIFELPSPVKTYKGQGSEVSDDKETVTFTNTLNQLFETPEAFEYKIDW